MCAIISLTNLSCVKILDNLQSEFLTSWSASGFVQRRKSRYSSVVQATLTEERPILTIAPAIEKTRKVLVSHFSKGSNSKGAIFVDCIKCGYRTLSMSGAMCINLWMNLLNLLQIGITILFLASTMLDLVGWGRNPERDIDSGETILQIFAYVPPSRYPYWIPLYFFLLLPRLYKEYDTGKLGDGIIWKLCGCFWIPRMSSILTSRPNTYAIYLLLAFTLCKVSVVKHYCELHNLTTYSVSTSLCFCGRATSSFKVHW